jgi:hypothetical protein
MAYVFLIFVLGLGAGVAYQRYADAKKAAKQKAKDAEKDKIASQALRFYSTFMEATRPEPAVESLVPPVTSAIIETTPVETAPTSTGTESVYTLPQQGLVVMNGEQPKEKKKRGPKSKVQGARNKSSSRTKGKGRTRK